MAFEGTHNCKGLANLFGYNYKKEIFTSSEQSPEGNAVFYAKNDTGKRELKDVSAIMISNYFSLARTI